ncbi:MAG: GHKL domain-containing protein [Butyrivibrio sp.]|nr:GHKL domain-containing protein [Butyrivibrio sp.]
MENTTLSMLLGIACSLIVSMILFNGHRGMLFFYAIANHAICLSVECLSGHFAIDVLELLVESVLLIAILYLVKSLSASKKNSTINMNYSREHDLIFGLISAAICGFAVCLYILEDILDKSIGMGIAFVIAEIVLIISVLAMVCLDWIFGAAIMKAREIENINIHFEKTAEYYQNMEELHEKYDTFIHDMRHQMRAVAALAEEGDCENIGSIIAQMRIGIGNIEKGIICSNKVLNALLLERKGYADDNCVPLDIEVIEPLRFRNMEDLDLVALIGNLLDNAIDAQKRAGKQDGILLSMKTAREGGHIVIHLENDYDSRRGMGKTIEKSMEQIGNKHGIGLNSVQGIVRKYGGIIENNKSSGRYVVDVILPAEDEYEGSEHQADSVSAYLHLLPK